MSNFISRDRPSDDNAGGSGNASEDVSWILSSTFIIFTMQSGFGLLESGSCTAKNEVNIMVKNMADVIFSGFSFWAIGFSLTFGKGLGTNSFVGWGPLFTHFSNNQTGWNYAAFFFQTSFATTASTIVSGCMAERCKLEAYIAFSFFNSLIFSFPAHWIWSNQGWLREMHCIDIAGAGPVHLVGGTTGLVATLFLRPRQGHFHGNHNPPPMGSPTNALLGMFMLWWGWLGFNCGSTFGMANGKWELAAQSAVSTICASMGGGIVGFSTSYIFKRRKFMVKILINSLLGSLVSITALCALCKPWEGFVIGLIGGIITCLADAASHKLMIDDPVGVISVHLACGIWSLLSVAFFAYPEQEWSAVNLNMNLDNRGLLWGGNTYYLKVQTCAILSIFLWTVAVSVIILYFIDATIGIRISAECEQLGADLVEHDVGDYVFDKLTHRLSPRMDNSTSMEMPTAHSTESSQTENIAADGAADGAKHPHNGAASSAWNTFFMRYAQCRFYDNWQHPARANSIRRTSSLTPLPQPIAWKTAGFRRNRPDFHMMSMERRVRGTPSGSMGLGRRWSQGQGQPPTIMNRKASVTSIFMVDRERQMSTSIVPATPFFQTYI